MKRKRAPASQRPFVDHVRQLEERLFAGKLHDDDASLMKQERRFWRFRPSHHIATGLLTQEDIALLSAPGRRLLSMGSMPAFLERLLPELGVPAENIVVADKDPAIAEAAVPLPSAVFDMHDAWPEIGTFDRIVFPESLCIAIGDRLPEEDNADHHLDGCEAELLAAILRQALERLRPGGIIRANGPMSHPNVMQRVKLPGLTAGASPDTLRGSFRAEPRTGGPDHSSPALRPGPPGAWVNAALREEGYALTMHGRRFFLTIGITPSSPDAAPRGSRT